MRLHRAKLKPIKDLPSHYDFTNFPEAKSAYEADLNKIFLVEQGNFSERINPDLKIVQRGIYIPKLDTYLAVDMIDIEEEPCS